MEPMNAREARDAIRQISAAADNLRVLLVEFHQRQGWKALGYRDLQSCFTIEFKHQPNYLYRQLAAAEVEQDLGVPIGTLRESQTRPFRTPGMESPDDRRSVYEDVAATGDVTAGRLADAVKAKLFDVLPPEKQEELMRAERLRYQEPVATVDASGLLPEQAAILRGCARDLVKVWEKFGRVGVEADQLAAALEPIIDQTHDAAGLARPRLGAKSERRVA